MGAAFKKERIKEKHRRGKVALQNNSNLKRYGGFHIMIVFNLLQCLTVWLHSELQGSRGYVSLVHAVPGVWG